jgi:thiol-disulfide isomerase/thioredoxin
VKRAWDVLAILAIGFVLWKVLIAPRSFNAPGSSPAPHAVFERLDGGDFRIADQRGRIVFLDFYASWCGPCRIELPLVQAWAKANPTVEVVPVDVGEPRAVALTFARNNRLSNVALDPGSNSRGIFSVAGFPTVVVVDPSGDIRARWEGLNPAIGLAMTNAVKRVGSPDRASVSTKAPQ